MNGLTILSHVGLIKFKIFPPYLKNDGQSKGDRKANHDDRLGGEGREDMYVKKLLIFSLFSSSSLTWTSSSSSVGKSSLTTCTIYNVQYDKQDTQLNKHGCGWMAVVVVAQQQVGNGKGTVSVMCK